MAMQRAAPTLVAGDVVGGCRIERPIGHGGMGEVYLAEQLHLQKPVAVKILPPDWGRPDLVQRFFREARIGARIEHPNVVTIHDVGNERGLHYIVMQFVEGVDLAELLRQQEGPLPWHSAVKIIRLVAKGLHAVHAQGLVHRDIKPSNIMLAKDGRVLLMDFGLIHQESAPDITQTGFVVGTVPFMSPEQCQGKKLDRRSDIFSLGCTLYNLLTAQKPFVGSNEQIALQIGSGKTPQPVHAVNPDVPVAVSTVVATSMEHRPAKRYQDAAAFSNALAEVSRLSPTSRPTIDDTTSFEAPVSQTQTIPELQLLDASPTEDIEVVPLINKYWLVGSGVVVAALLVGLLLNLGMLQWSRMHTPSKTVGMVKIEEGYAQLGNSEAKVRSVLKNYLTSAEVDKMAKLITREPHSRVKVPAFWIDQYEVTNAEYSAFLQATNRQWPSHWSGTDPPSGQEDHPVMNIRYEDAEAYAHWAGKELPTEAQWMRAFRGDSDQLFPWGDQYNKAWANAGGTFSSTTPVDATPRDRSPFGVCNMVGNVEELLRGIKIIQGNNFRVSKGATYNTRGCVYGVGSMPFYYALDILPRDGVGFRCVVEVP